jgi:diaminohydroxyphosphoribosylaminopyrimidine deaminase/5-amino-6-(5-phosphoribosylamino)uracil reductase
VPTTNSNGHPDLAAVTQFLGKMEITSLMIEGGAMVNGAALASGIVDKVFLYYAPRILGGAASVPFAAGTGFLSMGDAAHVKNMRLHRFGEDFAVEGYLKDPYSE